MGQSNSGRTNKFIKNVIGSAVLQIVTIVTGFISPKLMLGAFGSEINGITSSILQFISYISLVEAGLANATVFALYKPLAKKDIKERDAVISASRISYRNIGLIFVLLSVVLAAVYPFIGKTDALNYGELFILVLILCASGTLNFFILAKYRTLLTADQCSYAISYSSAVQLVVYIVLIYGAIKLNWGIIAVRAVGVLPMFLTALILYIFVKCRYGKINFYEKPNMKALDQRWNAMFLQILGVVRSGAPVVIMTWILDFKLISVYTIYNMIAGSITTCISVFTSGLSASFGDIYATGDKKLLHKSTEEFRTAFYILITIVYTVMLVTLMPFISLYTEGITDANYYLPLFGILITLNGLLDNMKAPHGMLVFSFGKFKVVKKQNMIQAVIIIVLGVVFTYLWGLVGIMAALCISNLYMLVEMLRITPKYLVDMSIRKNIFQLIRMFVIVFGLYFLCLSFGYVPTTYVQWLIYAVIVGVIAVAVTLGTTLIFEYETMKSLWRRAKFVVSNKFSKTGDEP